MIQPSIEDWLAIWFILPLHDRILPCSVHLLSRFMQSPRKPHYEVTFHILKYLKGTSGQGMIFPSQKSLQLKACMWLRLGGLSYYMMLNNWLLCFLWKLAFHGKEKWQKIVSLPSVKTCCELTWLQNLSRSTHPRQKASHLILQ